MLGELNQPGLTELFVALVAGDDEHAEAAIAGLAALPLQAASEITPTLRKLLNASQADTRWWAVRALAALPDPAAPAMLAQMLADPDLTVRQCAALGLRLRPDPQAVDALRAALSDDDPLLARLAGDALAASGALAVPGLLEIMQNGSQAARLQAVRALAIIGDTSSIPALFEALDEDSAWIEYWANEGLERMGVGMMFFKP
jgi:HEAT repeat protein